MLTTEMLFIASTACKASIASVLVSGVCVFKMIFASGSAERRIVRLTSFA